MARDQHRLGLEPVRGRAPSSRRRRPRPPGRRLGQLAQQAVLAPRDPRRQRLERIERLVRSSTKRTTWRWMPRVTSTRRSLLPFGERLPPGQVEEVGVARAHRHLKARLHRSRYATLAAWESVSADDLDASRARRRTSSDSLTSSGQFPQRPRFTLGRLDMTPPPERSTIASSLPDGLEPLDRLARNLAWTWDDELAAVLRRGRPRGFRSGRRQPGGDARRRAGRAPRAARCRRRLPRAPGARRRAPGRAPGGAELVRRRSPTRRRRSPTSRPSSA